MYSRIKSYFTYPIVCTAALVNLTGNSIFRTINALQFIYSFFEFKPAKMHPAVFVPAMLTGAGTAVVTMSTRFGAIENKMFKEQIAYASQVEMMTEPNENVSGMRKCAGKMATFSLYVIGYIAGAIASVSYYLGGNTLTALVVNEFPNVDDNTKNNIITYTSLLFMAAQAYLFFAYDLEKTFKTSRRIGHLIEQGELINELKQIDRPAAYKVLGLVGFTVLFSPLHAVFTTKPSLESLPFTIPDSVIDYIDYIAAFAHATKLTVGELPPIYERLKAGISSIKAPETSISVCGAEVNHWKCRIYVTYSAMALDSLAAGLTSFRSLSFSAEDFGGDPYNPGLIPPAILNGLSGGSKTFLFSGVVGLSDRINDWNKKHRLYIDTSDDASPTQTISSPRLLSKFSFLRENKSDEESQVEKRDDHYIELGENDNRSRKGNIQ